MDRPSRDRVVMEVAHAFSQRGTCGRLRVGAAIARNGRVLVTGYNGPPAGLPHCDLECLQRHTTGCLVAVHAEANAIAYAARHGIGVEDAVLYSTHLPCLSCAQLIINSGIARVLYSTDYRDHSGKLLLEAAGVDTMYLR